MAEGSSGAAGSPAGATSQGQAGSQSNTPQTTQPESTASETTQKESAEKPTSKDQVDKKTDINTIPAKKEEPEKTKEEQKKHKYADKLLKAFPDRKFEKDDDYDGAMDEYVGDLEGFKEKGTTLNKKLLALFDAEPHVGQIIRDMTDGATFRQALARHMDPSELAAQEGDPDYDGWTKNKSAREEAAAKRKEAEASRDKDLSSSLELMQAFSKESNLDEAKAEEFYNKIFDMVEAMNNGKLSKDMLHLMQKAFKYDEDIAKAREEGELKGKNANIVAKKEEPEKKGDGIPRPSKSTEQKTVKSQPSYMDNLVNSVNKRKVFE